MVSDSLTRLAWQAARRMNFHQASYTGQGPDDSRREAVAVIVEMFGDVFSKVEQLQTENQSLREEIQYALDRLSVRVDQGPGLRVLIDEATNRGDYFPASELKRRIDQIHEINHHFGEFQDFMKTVIEDTKQLKTEVEQLRIQNQSLQETFKLEKKPHSQLCLELEILKNELVAMKAAEAKGGE